MGALGRHERELVVQQADHVRHAFSVAPGAGGPPFTTPGTVGANCPGATVLEVGVDVGSYNPDYTVAVDGLRLQTATDSYTWDFGPK